MGDFNQHQFVNDLYECEQYRYLLQKRREEICADIEAKTKRKEYIEKEINDAEFQEGLKSTQLPLPEVGECPKRSVNEDFIFNIILYAVGGIFTGGIGGAILGFIVCIILVLLHVWVELGPCVAFFSVVGALFVPIFMCSLEIKDRRDIRKEIKKHDDLETKWNMINKKNKEAEEKYKQEYYQKLKKENVIGAKEFEISEDQRIQNYYDSSEYKTLESEIKVIDESYSIVEDKLNQLYSLRNNGALCIHPNYHGLVPISVIYGYFDTGRCSSLTGSDGAYNLYEEEKFKGMIASNLSAISSKLDTLNNTMYYVGLTLNSINSQLESLNRTAFQIANSVKYIDIGVSNVNDSLYDIKSSVSKQNKQLESIAKKTENIVYYEKVNAKINAIDVMQDHNLNQFDLNTKIKNINTSTFNN